jgi:hypothetical protein
MGPLMSPTESAPGNPSTAPTVLLGRVLAGATPFTVGNITDTYRGVILTDHGERTAVIKDLPIKELANEVLCAAIGLRLGLPVPPPYLAWAHPDRFQARKGPELGEGRLVFASVAVEQPQVAMLYNNGGGAAVLNRLAAWRALGRLYGFDALVANIDRHAGNILFSGDREVWLIDHGHCFTGPNWRAADLSPPDRSVPSRLSEWLTPVLDDSKKTTTARDAAQVETDVSRMDLRDLALANHMAVLLSGDDLDAVLGFLDERHPHVPRLAAMTLGLGRLV